MSVTYRYRTKTSVRSAWSAWTIATPNATIQSQLARRATDTITLLVNGVYTQWTTR